MASPKNPNPPGGGAFDVHSLFSQSAPSHTSVPGSIPNPQNFMGNVSNAVNAPASANFASAPFPPPTGGATGAPRYPYSPQLAGYNYHPGYAPYSNHPPPQPHLEFPPPYRSLSYPTPTLQPQAEAAVSPLQTNFQNPAVKANPNNHGARLMALLSAPPSAFDALQQSPMGILPTSFSGSDSALPMNTNSYPSAPELLGSVLRMPSSKIPKGRHLIGDRLVYDIDVRLPGEVQPQLEVTPITKYASDPGLVLGRQIAVNKTYICYFLKLGAIRVLNMNTALRSLLKGLPQRVTDMAFFAEDVNILASASFDGRVFVWKITEGPDGEDKPQIAGSIITAIQITGKLENARPRVCWHCHKQEVVVVGIGRYVLKIDTTKVGKGEKFSLEEPIKCPIDNLINGVQLIGTHDGDVTDLSMCQWMTTRLVSASVDGTIKIWEDHKPQPIAVLQPHDGNTVSSVTFLTSPSRPDHIVLITGGPLNREVKIWVSSRDEGWLLPNDTESWRCTQTLELKSSKGQLEEAFFNQVIASSQAGLLLLANAKRHAIYAIHLEYGPNPAATCMDYIAEFTVTMPILSFTRTRELFPHDEQVIQIYCVQTQAIQQYALNLSQCLPPPVENVVYQKDSNSDVDASISAPKAPMAESVLDSSTTINLASIPAGQSAGLPEFSSITETSLLPLSEFPKNSETSSVHSPSLPMSPRVSKTLSGFQSPLSNFEDLPSIGELSSEPNVVVDREMDVMSKNTSLFASLNDESRNYDHIHSHDDSIPLCQQDKFKHPTHLVTPSEILGSLGSEVSKTNEPGNDIVLNIQEVVISNDSRNVEVEVKVVDDAVTQHELETTLLDSKEKVLSSETTDLSIEMALNSPELSPEAYVVHEARHSNDAENYSEASTLEEIHSTNDLSRRILESPFIVTAHSSSNQKNKRQKWKIPDGPISFSPTGTAIKSDLTNEHLDTFTSLEETVSSLFSSLQQMLNQIVASQNDMLKQISALVADSVKKEGKQLEEHLGNSMEMAVMDHVDALRSHFQEEYAKQDKTAKDRMQQLTNMISGCLNKEVPAIVDKAVKREMISVVQSLSRSISTSIAECFQKGVGDKSVNQLEKSVTSKLEAAVSRHIQTQFQTSGKQALQESVKSSFETSVIPAFEMSCRKMFEQVDATFQKEMTEQNAAAQQQVEATHLPLATALRDAVNYASSMTQTLSSEIMDGQRQLLAIAVAGANSKGATTALAGHSNGPLGALHEKVEVMDPTKELSRLIGEHKYEEAFTAALQRSDVSIVSWLCSQVDFPCLMSMTPIPLSQGVLLSLAQQLACDMNKDTPQKLTWIREILSTINPTDPMIAVHVRPIFEQVYQILNHLRNQPTTKGAEASNIRLIMHVINSMLMTPK